MLFFSGQEQEVFSFPVHESHSAREDDGAISSVGGVTAAVSSTLKVVPFSSDENR
jgi:hypothetical protein